MLVNELTALAANCNIAPFSNMYLITTSLAEQFSAVHKLLDLFQPDLLSMVLDRTWPG